jgi:hypothetical protein
VTRVSPRRRVHWVNDCTCVFCGATGIGATGWTDVCPDCQTSPTRQAWHVELFAIRCAMALEAFARGLNPATTIAITPDIEARWRQATRP